MSDDDTHLEDLPEDSEAIEELCSTLHKSSMLVASLFDETYEQFRSLRKKVKYETISLEDVPLYPRSATRKWLTRHNLSESLTFQEFFAYVLDLLAKEHRLILARRTVLPNKELAKLFQVEAEREIHILEFLSHIPLMFH
jgi:hypothetical protein